MKNASRKHSGVTMIQMMSDYITGIDPVLNKY